MRNDQTRTIFTAQECETTSRLLAKIVLLGGLIITSVYLLTPVTATAAIARSISAGGSTASSTGLTAYRYDQAQSAMGQGDFELAGLRLTLLAEQGHREAQYLLGIAYGSGLGVTLDTREAARWYERAAAGGHRDAQYNLGVAYSMGIGVAVDSARAVNWWQKAAARGSTDAQFNLGLMYAQGEGVTQDMLEASKWWLKAALQGDAAAQYALGLMYVRGDGIAQDLNKALKWWFLSASQGFERAQSALGKLGLAVTPR
ncbi:MAG: hypothetical protein BMS9Abin10_0699 [Gammaproteobacteria bacterium]|nr:MAG: hypothetical protein BMS9Abin10_0699 [Gammaproteobacteria bacterium]